MSIEVTCECGQVFEAADALAGGMTNCPGCRRAVPVPGLRDPAWRALQGGALVGWCLAVAVAWNAWRLPGAIAAGLLLAALLWLVSRAL